MTTRRFPITAALAAVSLLVWPSTRAHAQSAEVIPDAVATQIAFLHDPDPNVLLKAVHALADLGPAGRMAVRPLVDELIAARQTKNETLEYAVDGALWSIGPTLDKSVVPFFNSELNDPSNPMRRVLAAAELADVFSEWKITIPELIKARSDDSLWIQKWAKVALSRVGRADVAVDPALGRDHVTQAERITRLRRALSSMDTDTVVYAALALGDAGAAAPGDAGAIVGDAVYDLQDLRDATDVLNSPDDFEVHTAALEALSEIGGRMHIHRRPKGIAQVPDEFELSCGITARVFGAAVRVDRRSRINIVDRSVEITNPTAYAPSATESASAPAVVRVGGRMEVSLRPGGAVRDTPYVVYPTEAQWRAFREALNRLDVWSWKRCYNAPRGTLDGRPWSFDIKYADREVVCDGDTVYPKTFDGLVKAIEDLIGIPAS